MMRLVGVDEVGRGPVAGPVTVCAVILRRSLPRGFFTGIRNSKALTETARLAWYRKAREARTKAFLQFAVASRSANFIDRRGIASALRASVASALKRLECKPSEAQIFLDGSLYAPVVYKNQKTIVRGDEKVPLIALASIIAKVHRDRRMKRHAKRFPEYGFDAHVGYGTPAHYHAIRAHGPCKLHRISFLTILLQNKRS